MSARRYSWIAMGIVLVAALAAGWSSGGSSSVEDRARAIESTIKCPICRSQSVETSETQISVDIRADVRRRLRAGESDDTIRQALAQRYGQDIQLIPPASGIAGLVWILPVAGLVVAVGGLALAFRRWRRTSDTHATDADAALVEAALAGRPDPTAPSDRDRPDAGREPVS